MYIAHITSDHRTQSVEDHLKNTATLAYTCLAIIVSLSH